MPTGALDLALWMESDRMGHLLPALTEEKFVNQRDVVLNERRQNYENRPYGLAGVALSAALFPPDHPYHWITIGDPDDLRAATLEDVRTFFTTYYHPGNASLTLAGDIDTARALQPAGIHIVHGHGGEAVRAAFAGHDDLHWVEQAQQLGTGHAVQQALPDIPEAVDVLVLYGDVPLTSPDTLRRLLAFFADQPTAVP